MANMSDDLDPHLEAPDGPYGARSLMNHEDPPWWLWLIIPVGWPLGIGLGMAVWTWITTGRPW